MREEIPILILQAVLRYNIILLIQFADMRKGRNVNPRHIEHLYDLKIQGDPGIHRNITMPFLIEPFILDLTYCYVLALNKMVVVGAAQQELRHNGVEKTAFFL